MRRIALISEHASPLATLGGVDSGGQNVYVGELARHLAHIGYSVDIFTRWDDARMPETVHFASGVRVVHVKAGPVAPVRKEDLLPHMGEFTKNVLAFSRKQGSPYRLFHANFWMSALVAADVKKLTNIPFVVTFHALGKVRLIHQGSSDEFPAERVAIEKRIINEADQIIAECPQDRDDLIALYGANPHCITIIPCGVSTQEFCPVDQQIARMILDLDPDERIILQLGRMVPRKGVANVIEALDTLRCKHGMNARLMVVGGESADADPVKTPEIGRLSALAERLGVADCITFVGSRNREALKYYYSAADVFVSTPWYEPFGITLLEAMACGAPVIGANVGGIKYSVVNGKTGFLVPPKQPEALADKLYAVLSNPMLARRFRQNGIRRVNAEFTWAKVAHSVSSLYERVLESVSDTHESNLTIIEHSFDSAIETIRQASYMLRAPILDASAAITRALAEGRKVLVCGNGGSAAQAQHLAGELVGRFQKENRPALPVIALTADTVVLTGWANDMGYDKVFARQIEAFGQPGDVLIGLTTSGKSPNIIQALEKARAKGMVSIALLGKSGGDAVGCADIPILVPSYNTQRIQEMHIHVVHLMCELVEKHLFSSKPASLDLEIVPKVSAL